MNLNPLTSQWVKSDVKWRATCGSGFDLFLVFFLPLNRSIKPCLAVLKKATDSIIQLTADRLIPKMALFFAAPLNVTRSCWASVIILDNQ